METDEWIRIPRDNPLLIRQWTGDHVLQFLHENADMYQFSEEDIFLLEEQNIGGIALLQLTREELQRWDLVFGPACGVMQLIIDLKNHRGSAGKFTFFCFLLVTYLAAF